MKSSSHRNQASCPAPAPVRLQGLDTLRSLAILTVMAFHVYELHAANTIPASLLPIIRTCWMGVDLFFVLSGFLIGQQILRPYARGHKPSLTGFYIKRFFRVLPAYAVVLTLYLAVPVWREAPHISAPWEFLTFTENYFVHYPYERAFSHAWSLCVEEHFYLFLPFVVMLTARKASLRRTVAALAFFVLLGIAIRAFVLLHWMQPTARLGQNWLLIYVKQIYYPTWSRLDGLLAGVTLALLRTFRPAWWSAFMRRGHTLFFSGAAFIALAAWLSQDRFTSVFGAAAFGVVFAFPILSLGLGLVVASALSQNGILARWRIPGAKAIATLAYALYLSHKGILHLTTVFFPQISTTGGLPWIALFAVSAFAAAILLYSTVERPFMLLRDKILHTHDSIQREVRVEPAL